LSFNTAAIPFAGLRFFPFWTAPAERSGDGAFERAKDLQIFHAACVGESSVALRLPPQSKTLADFR